MGEQNGMTRAAAQAAAPESDDSGAAVSGAWEQVDLLSFAAASPPAPAAPARSTAVEPPRQQEPPEQAIVSACPAAAPAGAGARAPERLLILDTETTGLEPSRHRCIEVGAVLFSVPHRAVLSQLSFLLPCESNEARRVNGIDPEATRQPQPWQQSLDCLQALVDCADVMLAHNAAFDRQWFGQGALPAIDKPWLCSMEDLRWPPELGLRGNPSVRDLALAHGVPVWAAHRALTDCIYLAQVFERCADLEALLQAGLEPRRLYRARLSYEERHKARDAGFRWNEPVSGAWSRRLSEREAALLTFPVVPVEEPLQPRAA